MSVENKSLAASKVFMELGRLASKPFDLTAAQALQAEDRLARYVCRSELFRFHFATERIDDEVLARLQDLSLELQLVQQFKKMRSGAVLNKIEGYESENRQVLHTACRDLFCVSPAAPSATKQAKIELNKLKQFLEQRGLKYLSNLTFQR